MDTENLKKVIESGETVEVELKRSFHTVQGVAKTISAFANTQGGILILGIKPNGSVEGIKENIDLIQQKISQSNSIIHPAPLVNVEVHTIDKKKVKGYLYYYIVEGKLENEKVRQKVIKYLGTAESILEKFKFWEENH